MLCGQSLLFTLVSSGRSFTKSVDLFNSETGIWTTAFLSVARYALAAASTGTVVLFAGGASGGGANFFIVHSCFSIRRGKGWLIFAALMLLSLLAIRQLAVTA